MQNKFKYKTKTGFNFNIVLLILIPIMFVGLTVAKYFKQNNFEIEYHAKNFYFESDLLSDDVENPIYEYENGNDSISFCLKNNEDNLRYSEVDINYIVTITDTEGNKVTDKNGEIISEKTGKIPKNEINSVDIEYTSLPEGSYIITAKAVSPYEKSISAIFNLKKEEEDFEYQVIDKINSPIVQVIVETKDYDGNIKLDWNDELFPDNTDINMEQVNLQSNIVKFNKNSSYTFTFFKSNPEKVYQKEKFSFTKVN